jgi:hypothetical protein
MSRYMTAEIQNRLSREIDRRMALAREWDDLVGQVRGLKGFEDFLRPPPLDSLLGAAARGPVVIVNVSQWRCDALIITTDGVQVVRLPDLTAEEITRRTASFLAVLQDSLSADPGLSFAAALEARARSLRERDGVLRSTTEWLWDAVAEPVLAALGISRADPAGPQARVWWCPTGLLALLPLHGAGYHQAGDGRTVLDRVISSYTPTLRALRDAMKGRTDVSPGAGRLLFVGVPEAPDQLPMAEDVAREHDFLIEHFPGDLTVLSGRDATVAAVQAAMPGHRWIHLSCHGYQDLHDPSAAGLELSDGILTVTRLSSARYAGDLAFLSACRTAAGGVDLPDEVITLAAALNYTGYRNVVATLWSVDPAVAAHMTAAVYTAMITNSGFEPDRSAAALHKAARALRDDGRPLDDWLPFTHTGP